MNINKHHANRPARLTEAHLAEIAKWAIRAASERRRRLYARLAAVLAVALVVALGIYAAKTRYPDTEETYRAVNWDGEAVAGGMSFEVCLDLFARPDVAGCHREEN